MGNNTWGNTLDPFPDTRGAAFNTFTTSRDISPVPLPMVQGNELRQGTLLDLEAYGEYTCATGITLQLGFHYGVAAGGLSSTGVIIAASGVITTGTSPTAWPWHLHWNGIVTAVGLVATGIVYGQGYLDLGTSLTVSSTTMIPVTAAARSVAIDTTVSKTFGVLAAYGTSSGTNAVTTNFFSARILNQGKTS